MNTDTSATIVATTVFFENKVNVFTLMRDHEGLIATELQFRLCQKCLESSKYQDIIATMLQSQTFSKVLRISKYQEIIAT